MATRQTLYRNRLRITVFRTGLEHIGASTPFFWAVYLAVLEMLRYLHWASLFCNRWPEPEAWLHLFRHHLGTGLYTLLQCCVAFLVIITATRQDWPAAQVRWLIYSTAGVLGLIITGRFGFELWLLQVLSAS